MAHWMNLNKPINNNNINISEKLLSSMKIPPHLRVSNNNSNNNNDDEDDDNNNNNEEPKRKQPIKNKATKQATTTTKPATTQKSSATTATTTAAAKTTTTPHPQYQHISIQVSAAQAAVAFIFDGSLLTQQVSGEGAVHR